MRRILLALVLVALTTTAANATAYVWWELAGSNCEAVATEQGRGHALVIEKPLTAPGGVYEFNLVMKMYSDWTVSTQGVQGHRSSLWHAASDLTTVASAVNDDPMTGSWSNNYLTLNSGQQLYSNSGRYYDSSGDEKLNAVTRPLGDTFVHLTIQIPGNEVYCDTHNIYQTVGLNAFSLLPTTATARQVVFGSNASVLGNATNMDTWAFASGTLPVIVIHAVPEPATLALLGLGLVALLRRR